MIFENIRLAFTSLISNKLRTILSLLGIIIGISSVITVSGLGSSMQTYMDNMFNDMGANVITVYPKPEASGVSKKFNKTFGEDVKVAIPDIVQVSPVESDYYLLKAGDEEPVFEVIGTSANFFDLAGYSLEQGELFTDIDNYLGRNVAVIGSNAASWMFPNGENPVGQSFQAYNFTGDMLANFTVIGVLAYKDSMGMSAGSGASWGVVIPYNSYISSLNNVEYVSAYNLQIGNDYEMSVSESTIKTYLNNVVGEDNYEISSPTMIVDMSKQGTELMSLVVSAIASISLLVGGIGIMNIMLVTVTERVKEIGVRKALGATPGNILGQFLIESMMLTLFGGIIGVFVGNSLSQLAAGLINMPLTVNVSFTIIALLFSTGIGMFFGIYPAWKASKLDPIVALNHE